MKLGRCTADNAAAALDPVGKVEREYRASLTITDAHRDLASKIIAFVQSDDFKGDSEYVQNLKSIFAQPSITARNFGFAASAIAAYKRHLSYTAEREAKAAATASMPASTHVGTVGQKGLTLAVTVLGHMEIESQYGVTHLYKFLAENGAKITWFASRDQDLNEGDKINLTGTVKAHGEYRGEAQTTMTRCKIA